MRLDGLCRMQPAAIYVQLTRLLPCLWQWGAVSDSLAANLVACCLCNQLRRAASCGNWRRPFFRSLVARPWKDYRSGVKIKWALRTNMQPKIGKISWFLRPAVTGHNQGQPVSTGFQELVASWLQVSCIPCKHSISTTKGENWFSVATDYALPLLLPLSQQTPGCSKQPRTTVLLSCSNPANFSNITV